MLCSFLLSPLMISHYSKNKLLFTAVKFFMVQAVVKI